MSELLVEGPIITVSMWFAVSEFGLNCRRSAASESLGKILDFLSRVCNATKAIVVASNILL